MNILPNNSTTKPIVTLFLDIAKSRSLIVDDAILDDCLNLSRENKIVFTQRNCKSMKNFEIETKEIEIKEGFC